jgi:hypothetical protein
MIWIFMPFVCNKLGAIVRYFFWHIFVSFPVKYCFQLFAAGFRRLEVILVGSPTPTLSPQTK